jgi:polyhydroxyalkanoate synthase
MTRAVPIHERTSGSGLQPRTTAAPVALRDGKACALRPAPSSEAAHRAPDDVELKHIRDVLDSAAHTGIARMTAGLSPAALMGAYADWAAHLAISPGKQVELGVKAVRKWSRLMRFSMQAASGREAPEETIEPLPQDKRFGAPEWKRWPYNVLYQAFLLQQQWWHNAMSGVDGVTRQHEQVVDFTTRQILDMASPSNFIATNPVVQQRILDTGGHNLVEGMSNALEDWERTVRGKPPVGAERFRVGRDVAATPGKVVFRNRLIELIQYAPTTETVRPEPILIVPAWIMKYYILDLSPANSLVRYLTDQGFTVFMISWKNPTEDDRDLGMDDYYRLGVMASVEAVRAIVAEQRIHAVGYCLGGTLLAIAASAMARDGDDRFRTVTLLAAQADFREAGELTLFINESQVHFLEDLMRSQGYLDAGQMAGTFQLLRSKDLIWSRAVHRYLMGERAPMTDLMAWNADATRMPYRMHAEYLRQLFLDNDLAEGRYRADGRPVAVTDIRAPIFAVGTAHDHVSPWRSVFKLHLLTDTEVTFLLASGGHNTGIVVGPERAEASFQVRTKPADRPFVDADTWSRTTPRRSGSWWPEWAAWLGAHSARKVEPPRIGGPGFPPLADAPGRYVLQD